MIGPFEATESGYRSTLGIEHNRLFQQLVGEILVVLDEPGDITSFVKAATEVEVSRPEPCDPALGHLLPPMSDDTAEAAHLRALTEDFLRSEKSSRLRRLSTELRAVENLGAQVVSVDTDSVWDWLAALNDIRLALAGELGIHSDADAERVWEEAGGEGEDPQRAGVSAMYVTITWWQDSLLRAVRLEALEH